MNFYISKNFVPVSGLVPDLLLQRSTDDYYYNGATWQSGVPASGLVLTEYDADTYPGMYYYTYTPDFEGELYIKVSYTDAESVVRTHIDVFTLDDVTVDDLSSALSTLQNSIDEITASGVQAHVSGVIIPYSKFMKIGFFS